MQIFSLYITRTRTFYTLFNNFCTLPLSRHKKAANLLWVAAYSSKLCLRCDYNLESLSVKRLGLCLVSQIFIRQLRKINCQLTEHASLSPALAYKLDRQLCPQATYQQPNQWHLFRLVLYADDECLVPSAG